MPIYEYTCEKCNKHLEIIQKITEGPLTTCPDCAGSLRKMISSTSFVLKGTGWYATDYASNKNCSTKTAPAQKPKDSSSSSAETSTAASTTAAAETTTKEKEPATSGK
jgi:putative FmdB family regulatory protein